PPPGGHRVGGNVQRGNQEAAYLRAMAIGLRRAGQFLEAFEALVESAGRDEKSPPPEPAGAALFVRRDLWRRGQLTDLIAACTPAERAAIERRIGERLTKAVGSKDGAALRQALNLYGAAYGDHRLIADARE